MWGLDNDDTFWPGKISSVYVFLFMAAVCFHNLLEIAIEVYMKKTP